MRVSISRGGNADIQQQCKFRMMSLSNFLLELIYYLPWVLSSYGVGGRCGSTEAMTDRGRSEGGEPSEEPSEQSTLASAEGKQAKSDTVSGVVRHSGYTSAC